MHHERGKLRRYCHSGTGKYRPNTARVYTDYGLFSCDRPSKKTFMSCSCD